MNGLMVLLGLVGVVVVVYGLVRVAWRSVGVGALFGALGFGGNWLFMQYGNPVLWAFAIGGAVALLWGLWNLLRTRRNVLLPVAGLLAGLVGLGSLGFLPPSVADPVNAVSAGAAGAAQTVASGLGIDTTPGQASQTATTTDDGTNNGTNNAMGNATGNATTGTTTDGAGSDPNNTNPGDNASGTATPETQTPDAAGSNSGGSDSNATAMPETSTTQTPDATNGGANNSGPSTSGSTAGSNSVATERPSPLLPVPANTTPSDAAPSSATPTTPATGSANGLRELEAACPCVLNLRVNANAATVKLLQGNTTIAAQSVDATGRTSLRVENAGAYNLVVEANGYGTLNTNIELPRQLNLDVALTRP